MLSYSSAVNDQLHNLMGLIVHTFDLLVFNVLNRRHKSGIGEIPKGLFHVLTMYTFTHLLHTTRE